MSDVSVNRALVRLGNELELWGPARDGRPLGKFRYVGKPNTRIPVRGAGAQMNTVSEMLERGLIEVVGRCAGDTKMALTEKGRAIQKNLIRAERKRYERPTEATR